MKSIIVLSLLITNVLGGHLCRHENFGDNYKEKDIEDDISDYILSFENDLSKVNEYNYGFETSNGIQVTQQGEIKNPGTESQHLETKGEYSYVGPDGVEYKVEYTAGENGFRPKLTSTRTQNIKITN